MASTPDELEQALMQFRLDVIEAFVSLDVEIKTLRDALQEKGNVALSDLNEIHEKNQRMAHRFRDHWAQTISLPHQPRTLPPSS